MRIRTIKPSFWRSDDITSLPMDLRLLFVGLWSYVDDNGVGIDDYRQIAADLFALEEDQTAIREFIREGLETLSRGLLVVRYELDGRSLIFIRKWDLHQKVDRPNVVRYLRPPDGTNPPTSGNSHSPSTHATSSRHPRETPPAVVGSLEFGRDQVKTFSEADASGAVAPPEDRQPALMLVTAPTPAAGPVTARDVTAAWVNACRENHTEPTTRQKAQVGKTAKELLAKNDPHRVLAAAAAAGAKGYEQIDRELTAMAGRANSRRNGHVPFKSPPSDEYVVGGLI